MEFRDLKEQYRRNQKRIDQAMQEVVLDSNFISGRQVAELEEMLAGYTGVKHCIACANGTDALQLALMVWDIGAGDAVFVPDFTFFSTAEVVSLLGATPVFVDIDERTFYMSAESLDAAIQKVQKDGRLQAKVIIAVDLFGQPADYDQIRPFAEKYDCRLLEDSAQGFGGNIRGQKSCSFGDISTTSFFPAKPLGCYGDGGAVFTDCDEWAELLRSYRVHGKGSDKYDNVRIGLNSRLDTIQAAILKVKFDVFQKYELEEVNRFAEEYTKRLENAVVTPTVLPEYTSSWAQYSILCKNTDERAQIQAALRAEQIPSMIYYRKPMHEQGAFRGQKDTCPVALNVTEEICCQVLSLPMHPYMNIVDIDRITDIIKGTVK